MIVVSPTKLTVGITTIALTGEAVDNYFLVVVVPLQFVDDSIPFTAEIGGTENVTVLKEGEPAMRRKITVAAGEAMNRIEIPPASAVGCQLEYRAISTRSAESVCAPEISALIQPHASAGIVPSTVGAIEIGKPGKGPPRVLEHRPKMV